MGIVYEATQLSLGRTVAIKLIVDGHSASTEARRRFQFEAEAAAKLDHPNIVPIYEVGELNGQPFLSMKLIEGETLTRKIASGEYALLPSQPEAKRAELQTRSTRIARLLATLARAVQHAHDHKVLHRDLKPGNVIIDHGGNPYLTDFGLAKFLDADGVDSGMEGPKSSVAGTVRYMSPEQSAGKKLSVASDIYSLGTVLYEMLTGEAPFKAQTLLESLNQLQTEPPRRPRTLNPRIDRDLETICLKCLEKNPAARYPNAGALADDLERWLRQEPIQARPAGVPLRLRRWVQRNKLATAFIFSLLLSLSLALVFVAQKIQEARASSEEFARTQQVMQDRVDKLWVDPEQSYVALGSGEIAILAGRPQRTSQRGVQTVTLGEVIANNPASQVVAYAPLLSNIADGMSNILGYPVNIDLRLYKFVQAGTRSPVTRGEVDFQRLGAVRYVQARQEEPELQLIACELPDKEGVLFARKDANITNLGQCIGSRVAFADPYSTITALAQIVLARAGITSNLLRKADYFPVRAAEAGNRTNILVGHQPAHDEVTRQIRDGNYDVGEAARIDFERLKRKVELVQLSSYKVPPDVIVARKGLDTNLVAAFASALYSVPTSLFSKLQRTLTGYAPANDMDYAVLRSALTNEIPLFNSQPVRKEDGITEPPTPDP